MTLRKVGYNLCTTTPVKMIQKLYYGCEFCLLFLALPLILTLKWPRTPVLLPLWILAVICSVGLFRSSTFDRQELWNMEGWRTGLKTILIRFAVIAVVTVAGLWILTPATITQSLVVTRPRVWLILMVIYPLLSVYPQGLVFRSFIFHRYRAIFATPWSKTVASTLAFCFAHIVFRNWVVLLITLLGGILFAVSHLRTKSLLLSSFEHALYGCFLFTVGIGNYFYDGSLG